MKISIVIPVYFNEDNLIPLYNDIKKKFIEVIDYDYEIVIIDNKSTDGTRDIIRELCKEDSKVKAIFNMKNLIRNLN